MTLNSAVPTSEERKAMLSWVDRLHLINRDYREAIIKLNPLLASGRGFAVVQKYQNREAQLGLDLYQGQITWGRYNLLRQDNDRQLRADIDSFRANAVNAFGTIGGASSVQAPLPQSPIRPRLSVDDFLTPSPAPLPPPVICRQIGPWVTCQ